MDLHVKAENVQRLSVLASLSDAAFDEYIVMLETRVEHLASMDSIAKAAASLKFCSPSDAMSVTEAVVPLLLRFIAEGEQPKDIATAVVEGIRAHSERTTLKSKSDLGRMKSRLTLLLGSGPLSLQSKATSLAFERGLVLSEVKIVSDLRPVFVGKKVNKVDAFTLIHTLVIECYEQAEVRRFHVALDLEDISKLKRAADRALAKDSSLADFVKTSGVAQIKIG